MRAAFIAILIVSSCTAPRAEPLAERPIAAEDLAISLRRDTLEGRPILVVELTNRSHDPLCIHADALQNPYSGYMQLRLRDSRGRRIGYQPPGLIEPPIEGVIRVEPGGVERRPYFLGRFILRNNGVPFPQGLSAQASVRYGICNDIWAREAISEWQPI